MLTQAQIMAAWAPRCTGPFLKIGLHGEGKVTVRPAIGDAVLALNAILVAFNYRTRARDTGAGNCRPKVGGRGWSIHAFWIALDLNWSTNPYGSKLHTDMPFAMVHAICAIRTNNGKQVWNWGGFWSGNKDAMHFEIVCSPRDLATGINPMTVLRGNWQAPHVPGPTPTTPTPVKPPAPPKPVLFEEDIVHNIFIVEGHGIFLGIDGRYCGLSLEDLVWHREHYKKGTVKLFEQPKSPAQAKAMGIIK